MKITYPECQVEISTDEVIDLLDYFDDRKPKVECRQDIGHLNIKLPELHIPTISKETKKEIEEMMRKYFEERTPASQQQEPSFEPGGFVPDDEQPAPKPYPEAGETLIPGTPEDEAIFSSAARRFVESEEKRQLMEDKLTEESLQRIVACEDKLEDAINGDDADCVTAALAELDDAWLHAETKPVETPEPEPQKEGKHDSKKKNKSSTSTKRKTNSKKVDVLFETGWKTFASVAEAAKAIGVKYKTFYSNLTTGKPCNGHQVRYNTDTDGIMDAIMAEIKESDRKHYEPSKPVR